MAHLLPTKTQRVKEMTAFINDLTALIAKANAEGKHWTLATLLRLKESVTADLAKIQ